jgi:hypothetical protein
MGSKDRTCISVCENYTNMKLGTAVRSHIASWLTHLDAARLAQTCKQWRVAVDSALARETLDLRVYTVIGKKNVPNWCWVLLRLPQRQVERSWRCIYFPELGGYTCAIGQRVKDAFSVFVKLLKHTGFVYNIWCTVDLVDMLVKDAHQQNNETVRVLTAAMLLYLDNNDDDGLFEGAQRSLIMTGFSSWSSNCPGLQRVEVDSGFDGGGPFKSLAVMLENRNWIQQFRDVTKAEIDEFKMVRKESDRKNASVCCIVM